MKNRLEVLWAPWRKGYVVQTDKEKGCLFCRVRDEKDDQKNLVLLRNKEGFLILNRFPYNNGHLMVVPNRHLKDLDRLRTEEATALFCLIKDALQGLSAVLHPEGFNLGVNIGKAGGAGVTGHIHIHIVPRWIGDTNFMPAVSAVKAVPDSLNALYQELTTYFKR